MNKAALGPHVISQWDTRSFRLCLQGGPAERGRFSCLIFLDTCPKNAPPVSPVLEKENPEEKGLFPSLFTVHLPWPGPPSQLPDLSVRCVSEFLTAPQTPATSTMWGQLCVGHCADPEGPAEPGWVFNRSSQRRGGRQESSHQGCDAVSARIGVHAHRSSTCTLVTREGSTDLGSVPKCPVSLSLVTASALWGPLLPCLCGPDWIYFCGICRILANPQVFPGGDSQAGFRRMNEKWLYSPWNSPGQNSGLGSLSILQGIFPTQGSNPGLPHCGQILYQLSHQGRMNGSWQMKDKRKDLRQKEPHRWRWRGKNWPGTTGKKQFSPQPGRWSKNQHQILKGGTARLGIWDFILKGNPELSQDFQLSDSLRFPPWKAYSGCNAWARWRWETSQEAVGMERGQVEQGRGEAWGQETGLQ